MVLVKNVKKNSKAQAISENTQYHKLALGRRGGTLSGAGLWIYPYSTDFWTQVGSTDG